MQAAMTAPNEDDEPWAAWEAAYDEVRRAVSLSSPTGPVPEFLLHIEGDQAWFRWGDEPSTTTRRATDSRAHDFPAPEPGSGTTRLTA